MDESGLAKSTLPGLARKLSPFVSTMMMGIVIGSGIFLTTGIMAKSLPSGSLILLVWLPAGKKGSN